MRTKLLLMKTFLIAFGLLVGSNVWATTKEIVETYDFEAWGKAHMSKANNNDIDGYATMGTEASGISVNGNEMNKLYITSNKNSDSWDLGERFIVSSNTTFRWGKGNSDVPRLGNENQSGVRYISIIDLKEGDRIILTCSNVKFYSANATYLVESTPTSLTTDADVISGTEYTITGSGSQRLDLSINSGTWGNITKVVITRNVVVEEVKSWEFTSLTWAKETGFEESTIKINNVDCKYAIGALEGLALQVGSGTDWTVNSNGLFEGNGTRSIGVLDLKANDLVEVVTTTTLSSLVNGTSISGNLTGTCTFSVTSDGAFGFGTTRYEKNENTGIFTSIKVYREKKPAVNDGTYYLKNKATGLYLANGLKYGTQSITNSIGHHVNLSMNSDIEYSVDTEISNGTDNHFLGSNLYCDATVAYWDIIKEGEYYIFKLNSQNLTANASGEALTLTNNTSDNTKWQLLSAAEWKAEQVARLDAATANNGVDATFYIPGANFNRNDGLNSCWQGSPKVGGLSGDGSNYNAEKFTNPYATFDVYQELTGIKAGAYKLSMQGFYRNGLDNASDANDNLAILYANNENVQLINIRSVGFQDNSHNAQGFTTEKSGYYVPDSQTDASQAFNNDYYHNELYVVVNEDGTLRIGVKKDAATGADRDWTVMDNFQLTYYGNSVSATIGSTGWTTFSSNYPLNLSNMTASEGDVTAYYASTVGDGKVTMTSIEQAAVAAGQGIMLKGTVGATITIPVVASGETITGNKLVGCPNGETLTKNDNYYVLVSNGGTPEFQSLAINGATIPAGKAYLNAGATARSLQIVFDETTGVEAMHNAQCTMHNEMYDLQGRRVAQPKKGLYIKNGQKVYIK